MTDDINWNYVDWMNSLLRPKDNLAEGLEELARLKAENEQLRTLLEEASDFLLDAVDVMKYAEESTRDFVWYEAEEWVDRYRRVVPSKDPSSDREGSHD